VAVGQGALKPDAAAAMLRSDSDAPARLTAPASGLFLERVYYHGEPRAAAIAAPIAVRGGRGDAGM
jgi:tRNA U38,U39,U40 pseudouridine synthase TruA